MDGRKAPEVGLRERKRQETLHRLSDVAFRLFLSKGYQQTTLDEIADAAGISRRTFFYYFSSKEDILGSWRGKGLVDELRPTLLGESPEQSPLMAVRATLLRLAERYEDKDSLVLQRLFASTEALRQKRLAVYLRMEEIIYGAFSELYPQPNRRTCIRFTAMIAMGVWRLTVDKWLAENAKRSFAYYLRREFDCLMEIRTLMGPS
jgi:AcrR family transcriptional regulator